MDILSLLKVLGEISGGISIATIIVLYGKGRFRQVRDTRDLTELQLEQAKNQTLTNSLADERTHNRELQERLGKMVDMSQVKELVETIQQVNLASRDKILESIQSLEKRHLESHQGLIEAQREIVEMLRELKSEAQSLRSEQRKGSLAGT